jgi:hypothetical protein
VISKLSLHFRRGIGYARVDLLTGIPQHFFDANIFDSKTAETSSKSNPDWNYQCINVLFIYFLGETVTQ